MRSLRCYKLLVQQNEIFIHAKRDRQNRPKLKQHLDPFEKYVDTLS